MAIGGRATLAASAHGVTAEIRGDVPSPSSRRQKGTAWRLRDRGARRRHGDGPLREPAWRLGGMRRPHDRCGQCFCAKHPCRARMKIRVASSFCPQKKRAEQGLRRQSGRDAGEIHFESRRTGTLALPGTVC